MHREQLDKWVENLGQEAVDKIKADYSNVAFLEPELIESCRQQLEYTKGAQDRFEQRMLELYIISPVLFERVAGELGIFD